MVTALRWLFGAGRAGPAAFRRLTRTTDRQRHYRAWALTSLAMFGGTTLVALAGLGRLVDLVTPPAEFTALAQAFQALLPAPRPSIAALAAVLVAAIAMGTGLGALAASRRSRPPAQALLGDVEALLPRNRAECFHVVLLSLNAGLCEELFFRLLLPLVLTMLTGNAAFAFVLAALTFGLVHAYQGWAGIAATTVLGFALAALYLSTGSLWLAITVHALLDLSGLLVRPLTTWVKA